MLALYDEVKVTFTGPLLLLDNNGPQYIMGNVWRGDLYITFTEINVKTLISNTF